MKYELKDSSTCPVIPPGHTAELRVTGLLPDGRATGDWTVAPTPGFAAWWLRVQYACVIRPLQALGVKIGDRPKLEVARDSERERK